MNESQSLARGLFVNQISPHFCTSRKVEIHLDPLIIEGISNFMRSNEENFRRFDEEGFQPPEFIDELKNLGLFGLVIPEEYGGLGLNPLQYARVLEEMSAYDGATTLTVGAHNSIGMKGLLLFGNEAQKTKYLPRLSSGELIASFCLTESHAGSDAGALRTKVARRADGSYVLNGEKIWITNGDFANFFTVFARHEDMPESISAFIVERAFSGVTSGRKEDKMGIRASATTTVTFNDVALPKEALLATEGSGFKIAMAILNSGRSGLGGGCVGGMKQAIRNATTHAESRKQFDKTLIEFPLIQEKLAEMKLRMFATESLTMLVGELITTASSDYAIEAAALKIYSTENLWYVANEALQIAGGVGYMREYPYERLVRDSRINLIFEGTNEVLRLFIALSGLKGVGEYLQTLQTGISNFWQTPIDSFEILWDYVEHRFGVNSGSNTESLLTLTKGAYREEIRILRRVINLFAVSCENFTRRYRKEVVEKQLELTALANVAIELLASLAVLRRVAQDESIERSLGRAILRAHIHTAKRVCKHNLRKLEVNEWQERKVVSRLLRV